MQSEHINELAAALAKAQGAMKNAPFDKQNPHFRNSYASLASITDTIRAPLSTNGLAYSQATEIRDGAFVLVTTLMHSSGQWRESAHPLPMVAKPQELGAALTYARRYSLSAITGIAADEDEDAEGARQNGQTNSISKAKAGPINPQPTPPPVDPETGEISPHKITASDPLAWGAKYVAAINAAGSQAELDLWKKLNEDNLAAIEGGTPKVYARVTDRWNEKSATFNAKAA